MRNRFKRTVTVLLAAALCAVLLAGCGKVKASETAVTVNGEAVSAGTASTYVRYQQAESYSYQKYIYTMYGMEFDGSKYWNETYGEDGQTYGESFLSAAKEDLVKMILIRQHAPEYGYSLTDEDNKAISEAAARFIEDNGSVAKWIGADQTSVENLLSLYNYQAMTRELFIADVDRNVTDEEAAQSTVIYASITKTMPEDFEGTEEEYTTQAKAQMEQMLKASKEADPEQILAEEHAEDEDALDGEEDSEDLSEEETDEDLSLSDIVSNEVDAYKHIAEDINSSITVSQASFSTNDEEDATLSKEVLDAARKLADGDFSDRIIETDTAYYIVKMEAVFDEDATESKKDEIISERENTAYTDLIQSWMDSSEIVYGKAFDKITVSDRESYIVPEN